MVVAQPLTYNSLTNYVTVVRYILIKILLKNEALLLMFLTLVESKMLLAGTFYLTTLKIDSPKNQADLAKL